MNFKKLGNTDLKVSTICLGTMTWGEQNNQKEAFEQMNYALDSGINFFDTAEIYPSPCFEKTYGSTEKIIGKPLDVNAKQWINFSRLTFVHKTQKERLTIDINLSFENEKESGDLRDIVIAEVKQERMSRKSDFMRIAKEMSILPMRLSKYCISTMQLWKNIKQNRFKKKQLFINKLKQV